MTEIESKLDQMECDGYLHIKGALTPDETELVRSSIFDAKDKRWEEGLNTVGNMWFDTLLEKNPDVFSPLVAHPSVAALL